LGLRYSITPTYIPQKEFIPEILYVTASHGLWSVDFTSILMAALSSEKNTNSKIPVEKNILL
jgi:hypothetical protein